MNEIRLHRTDLNLLVLFEALMLEGSVAGAAAKLNKTPSAVSHALGRLRDQVGDPLMVKVGGRMQASPFALELIEDVQPILSSIKRVLKLPEPFDPMLSTRAFRIACPISAKVLFSVVNSIQRAAPGIRVDWLAAPREVYAAVAEGHIDLAHLGGHRHLPEGLEQAEMPPMKSVGFVRKEHPALQDWSEEAWNRCGNIKVAIDNEVLSPVDIAPAESRSDRHIAARISEFAGVRPLLANSDLIATLPVEDLAWDMQTYGLVPMQPIVPFPPFRARFFWSARTSKDPALVWIRNLVLGVYRSVHRDATALVGVKLAKRKGKQ